MHTSECVSEQIRQYLIKYEDMKLWGLFMMGYPVQFVIQYYLYVDFNSLFLTERSNSVCS